MVTCVRFLPSIVVGLCLLAGLFFVDRFQVSEAERMRRDAAEAMLFGVQSEIDRIITSSMRGTRRLAASVRMQENLDQDGFEALVQEHLNVPATLERIEYAPGFVTTLVYPQDGNEVWIGQSPVHGADTPLDAARQVADRSPALSQVGFDESGEGELHVRAELRRAQGAAVLSSGLLHLVVRFRPEIDVTARGGILEDPEFLYRFQPARAPAPELPPEWEAAGNRAPLKVTMRYPPGDFLLYLRPERGWSPGFAAMADQRLMNLAIAVLVLLPVVLANWYAVSREQARLSLSQTRGQMGGLLRNLPGAALTYTMPMGRRTPGYNDEIRFLNPAACKTIFGIDAAEVERDVGKLWARLANEASRDIAAQAFEASISDRQNLHFTSQIETPQGDIRWIEWRGHPTRQPDGSLQWLALVTDCTETTQRDRELIDQRELTFRAQKTEAIGQLTGGVAHDFNNLLAAILGNLELLREEETDADRLELLQAAIKATLRGADLTHSMLAFAGRARLTPRVFDMNALVNETRVWIGRTLPETVTIRIDLDPDARPVHADQSSTEAALLNLILNARDAMDGRGEMTIRTRNLEVFEEDSSFAVGRLVPGRYVALSVTDTGHGITEPNLADIFAPFFTTKSIGKGSGLGLSMVAGFMEQSGGAIGLCTGNGDGATFTLYFPAAAEDRARPEISEPRLRIASAASEKLLVVEDEIGVRDVLVRLLAAEGYDVIACETGEEALAVHTASGPFDLLISDIVMPGSVQGPDLARAMRMTQPDLPVILITGYSQEKDAPTAGTVPDVVRLMKPIRRQNLIRAVARLLADR